MDENNGVAGFKVINSIDEYKEFMLSVKNVFSTEEDWEDFFGFSLRWDEKSGEIIETLQEYEGQIDYAPKRFPVVLYHRFETQYSTFTKKPTIIKLVDWAYEDELEESERGLEHEEA